MTQEPTPKPFQCWSCGFVVTSRSKAEQLVAWGAGGKVTYRMVYRVRAVPQ